MKKLLFLLLLSLSIGFISHAQDKDKMKKTSTMPEKVHNTVSKHKHYKGYKIKHKHNGHKHKRLVNLKDNHEKNKDK